MARPGLYANIADKKARIKAGSGEKMRKPGLKFLINFRMQYLTWKDFHILLLFGGYLKRIMKMIELFYKQKQ